MGIEVLVPDVNRSASDFAPLIETAPDGTERRSNHVDQSEALVRLEKTSRGHGGHHERQPDGEQLKRGHGFSVQVDRNVD